MRKEDDDDVTDETDMQWKSYWMSEKISFQGKRDWYVLSSCGRWRRGITLCSIMFFFESSPEIPGEWEGERLQMLNFRDSLCNNFLILLLL
jgi:hypothetical protein